MEQIGDVLRGMGSRRPAGNEDPAGPDHASQDSACERCGGPGWYTVDVAVTDPRFGSVETCECQEGKIRRESSRRLHRYSNLGPLSACTFDSLSAPAESDPDTAALFEAAKSAAQRFAESPRGWLILSGDHGSGKTRLAAAIANRVIGRGHVALFMHLPDLMDHLRASFGPTSEMSYTDLFEKVRSTPLLILDNVGGSASTPWALEKLQQIVNHRFNAELPTVFTSAVAVGGLDPYLRARIEAPNLSQILTLRRPSDTPGMGAVPPELLERMSLDTFDPAGNNPSPTQQERLQVALETARGFATYLPGWLTIRGPTGVGKTHLAVAIAKDCLSRGHQVFYAFVPDLLDHLRGSFDRSSPVNYDRAFESVRNAELLILDDLTGERSGTWAHEKLLQIIVHRHNRKLPTVITTAGFGKEMGPISSRATDKAVAQVVDMDAPDFRVKGRREDPLPPRVRKRLDDQMAGRR